MQGHPPTRQPGRLPHKTRTLCRCLDFVVRASRPHDATEIDDVRPGPPHHNFDPGFLGADYRIVFGALTSSSLSEALTEIAVVVWRSPPGDLKRRLYPPSR